MLPARLSRPLGDLDPAAARELVQTELSRARYQASKPGLVQRAVDTLFQLLGDLLDKAASHAPGGYLGLLGAFVLLVALVVVVTVKAGPLRRSAAPGGEGALLDPTTSPAGHRAAADAAAARGRWADAVRERLRAVVAELEATGLLVPRPGRTAGQVAREAGALNIDLAPALADGTERFSQVWYGGRPADAGDDAALRRLDDAVVATGGRRRPAPDSSSLALP